MKYLLILITIFSGCFSSESSTYKLSNEQERDLINVVSYLRQAKFNGSISINSKEVRNSSAEIISTIIPESVYLKSSKYSFVRVVNEPEFTYFVMDGFKGKNFGLLFTPLKKEDIKGFYDIELIRKARDNVSTWYFVSSKI